MKENSHPREEDKTTRVLQRLSGAFEPRTPAGLFTTFVRLEAWSGSKRSRFRTDELARQTKSQRIVITDIVSELFRKKK